MRCENWSQLVALILWHSFDMPINLTTHTIIKYWMDQIKKWREHFIFHEVNNQTNKISFKSQESQ